ncbi:hypothetical protein BC361_18380 [Ensifer sp. LC54]|nr:hypothetical protein BC361_18380 [Ensifer sp. LC54]OCP25294.1 hypothetical protein BC363_20770 [Ensifer sp. LC384]
MMRASPAKSPFLGAVDRQLPFSLRMFARRFVSICRSRIQALFVSSSIVQRSDAFEVFKPTDGAFDEGISMRAEVGALCATQAMLQEYHVIGSVRPEGMSTIARYGRTAHSCPQRQLR